MRKKENDNPVFVALSNKVLVCKDCKYRGKPDCVVLFCKKFVDEKPLEILFEGASCPEYEKEN